MAAVEPQFASDYDDRSTVAVKSVLVEIDQVLHDVLGERTADQWQQDAFGQVDAWLSASGLR